MRTGNLVLTLGFVVACHALMATAALAEHDGRGGPLPLLGVSLLGQAGATAGGAFLLWRRRRKAAAKRRQAQGAQRHFNS